MAQETHLVIHPRAWDSGSSTATLIVAGSWLAASVAYLFRLHGVARVALAAVDVMVLLAAVALFRRSAQRTKLTLASGRLNYSGAFRDRAVFGESRPGRVVEIELDWGRLSRRRSRLWLLTNSDGRAEVTLNLQAWNRNDLESLRQHLGVPLEIIDKPLRLTEAHKAFARAIPWWEVHPLLTTYAVIGVITIAVLGARLTS